MDLIAAHLWLLESPRVSTLLLGIRRFPEGLERWFKAKAYAVFAEAPSSVPITMLASSELLVTPASGEGMPETMAFQSTDNHVHIPKDM